MSFEVGGKRIGPDTCPFIIAEMSGNHNQSLTQALAIVDAAAKSGAHALKIQTYTAETMTIDCLEEGFLIKDPESLWFGSSLFSLYQEAQTPWEWHSAIFDRAKQHGMLAFSTPFDETAVDFLQTLNAPLYKIASFENTDLPLIKKVAATGKPVIISTGMATIAEIDEAVRAARSAGCSDLVLLKCTSTYPASPVDSNVLTIPHMRDLFQCEVGLSDHTMGIGASIAAVALGATVIEKHFTLERAAGGVDASFSMEPSEMSSLVTETERAWQSLGKINYGVSSVRENKSLDAESVKAIRPGFGLAPKYLNVVLGKSVKGNIKRGTPVGWNLLG
jgi:pseudaminic acid synthase